MTFPNEPTQLPEPHPESRISARARRRRARRTFFPKDAEGRTAIIAALAKRAYPSYELFIYSLLCGVMLGVGYIFDSYGVLVLGILFAPLMAPWFGLILSAISGMPRLFVQTAAGLLVSATLVFGASALAGLASRLILPHTFNAAFTLSRLWWPEMIVIALGAILLTVSFVRSESKPYLPSVVVAYGLFMPLSASGFGVGNGIGDLWPHGALVSLVHLAWSSIFGLFTLAILRFRPLSGARYAFALGVFAISILAVFWLTDPSKAQTTKLAAEATLPTFTLTLEPLPGEISTPTALPSTTTVLLEPTETESVPEATSTAPDESVTPVPLTLDVTLPVTETRTSTPAPEPTPIYAVIRAREGGGAYIRREPGGNVIATLDNGSVVQILPETQDYNGVLWIHIVATRNDIRVEGWIIQTVLETATPVPNWEPSETPTP
ncbi:MAG: SH3 domain-containing protein [Anaerolineales bacterium]|nr:SH3 domain-containing protein [Anaerolineales bacterium]